MKKRRRAEFVLCCIFLLSPNMVLAHPGRTDSSGCHTCKTNCAKWGLNSGEYHCHSGNTYTNSKGKTFNSSGSLISSGTSSNTNSSSHSNNQTTTSKSNSNSHSNNQTVTTKPNPKSSDNTLKKVTIEGKNIEVSDNMSYKTKQEKIQILVETNDSKATYDISNSSLKVGRNRIDIKVTAENGNVKNYKLVVDREKLSNNTNIKIIVDDEEIKFSLGKAKIDVSSDTKDLNYKYELEDVNSTVTIEGDKDLEFGKNIVNFTVKAEDGTEAKYELTVNKLSKNNDALSVIMGLATMGGIDFIIYNIVRKRK